MVSVLICIQLETENEFQESISNGMNKSNFQCELKPKTLTGTMTPTAGVAFRRFIGSFR